MIDIQRLGLLLRTLGRSEAGLKPAQTTSQVRSVPGLVPAAQGTHTLVRPDAVEALMGEPQAREQRHDVGSMQGERMTTAVSNAAARKAPADPVALETRSAALTLSRAAQVLGAVLRENSAAYPPPLISSEYTEYAPPRAAALRAGLPAARAPDDPFSDVPSNARDADPAVARAAPEVVALASRATSQDPIASREALQGANAAPARARALVPVAPDLAGSRDRFAGALQQAVEFSGVFYESHVAQWVEGTRTMAHFAREPQAHWDRAVDVDGWVATNPPSSQPDAPTAVVRHQLDVLETGRFAWAGELWPGQRGALMIEPEHGGTPPPGETETRWRTTLHLELASLGNVAATLMLQGKRVTVTIACAETSTARSLSSATPALRVAVGERGLELAGLMIANDHVP